eukprot:TRINITY_DN63950_c0_g1_i1.p1 TRINITY_DN63950_c0_g1~~TRINITY_DN63950_c0_g1_i1.p1  ORF type:complete len:404 (+),score=39.62 TRINITY_DN63950_c0_g1_i1:68-1279(+)
MAGNFSEPLLAQGQHRSLCRYFGAASLLGLGLVACAPWLSQKYPVSSLLFTTPRQLGSDIAVWTTATPLPGKRMGHQGGVNATHVFVVAGFDGKTALTSVLAYGIQSDSWSSLSSLPLALSDSGAAVSAGRLWAMGGMSNLPGCPQPVPTHPPTCNVSTVLSLDLGESSSTWTKMASMPTARRGLSVGSDEKRGILYAVGGLNCKGDCYGNDIGYFDTVEAFSVSSGTWETLPPMPTPRRDLGVAVDTQGRLWALGGCGGHNTAPGSCPTLGTVEIYDPATGTWQSPHNVQLPEPRHGLLVATDGTSIYAIGGSAEAGVFYAPKPSAAAWRLDVTSDLSKAVWHPLPSMLKPRYGLNKGYGYIVDGKIYAIGGSIGSGGGFLAFEPDSSVEVLAIQPQETSVA